MAHTITLTLSERAASAFVALRNQGIDAKEIVETALVREATHVVGRAEEAAHLRDDVMQRTELEKARDLPPQIEYVRPPR